MNDTPAEQTVVNKPGMGLGSRSKVTADGIKIKTQKLFIPRDALRYQARKTQQLLHILDARLLVEPEKINIKSYLEVLAEYTRCTDEIIKKEKINGTGKKTKKGMDKTTVDETDSEQTAEDVFSN